MSIVALAMNVLLAALLAAALAMGWRLNRRLKSLRDSHDRFAVAVRELNTAAARAEQGLADLRASTDEAIDLLADRIEKGRALAAKLEKLTQAAPTAPTPPPRTAAAASRARDEDELDLGQERRLGALHFVPRLLPVNECSSVWLMVASVTEASGLNHCIDPQVGSWSRCLLTFRAT